MHLKFLSIDYRMYTYLYDCEAHKKFQLMCLYIRLGRSYCFDNQRINEMTTTPEGRVSAALRQAVINCGGEIRKILWQGRVGAPDWLVMLGGGMVFVETKSPGARPRKSQLVEFGRIYRACGIPVLVVDRAEDAIDIIDAMLSLSEGNHEDFFSICEEYSFERFLKKKQCG